MNYLSDRGSGVSRGVERIGLMADLCRHLRHLGNATSIVTHGAVRVNRKASSERSKHTDGRKGDAIQVAQLRAEKKEEKMVSQKNKEREKNIAKYKYIIHILTQR
jgi:hypothetical protein